MKNNSQDWKEEFENQMEDLMITTNVEPRHLNEYKVKAFISSLLSSREKEIVEKIKNNLPKAEDQWLKVEKLRKDGDSIGFMLGWNEYEDELLKIIKK